MKRLFYIPVILFFITLNGYSQQNLTFERVLPINDSTIADLVYTYDGTVGLSDIDLDGDLDIIQTINDQVPSEFSSGVFRNDGHGNFNVDTLSDIAFSNKSALMFIDVDNDLDEDLIISGITFGVSYTNLYLNDATGVFTIAPSVFSNVSSGSLSKGDLNNDSFSDVLITGKKDNGDLISEVYFGDGLGNFILQSGSNFQGVYLSGSDMSDLDNDGDLDIVISGSTVASSIIHIYMNDGVGNFTLNTNSVLEPAVFSSIELADMDGDSDFDLIYLGLSSTSSLNYYINDGNANFTTVPFNSPSYNDGDVDINDYDNDGDQDVLISGIGDKIKVYLNDGLGGLTENIHERFFESPFSTFAAGDLDLDNDLDFVNVGRQANVFFNDGNANFEIAKGSPIYGFSNASMGLFDYDLDGNLDLFISGVSADDNTNAIYLNDGQGNFSLSNNSWGISSARGEIEFFDADNDNDNDLFFFSQTESIYYINENGVFGPPTYLPYTMNSSQLKTEVFDFDGNGLKDILLVGSNLHSIVFVNQGGFNFDVNTTTFPALEFACVSTGDIDNDGDLDLYLSGFNQQNFSLLFENNGFGNYSEVPGVFSQALSNSDAKFTDLNNDGFLDFIRTGEDSSAGGLTEVYFNDGTGGLVIQTNQIFPPVFFSTLLCEDFDLDNDIDMILTGVINGGEKVTNLYINDGNGNLDLNSINHLMDFGINTEMISCDIDNDLDQDFIIAGYGVCNESTIIYKNTSCLFTNNHVNTFSTPTQLNACTGELSIHMINQSNYNTSIDGNSFFNHSNITSVSALCAGIHSLQSEDTCNNLVNVDFVIPNDTTYIFIDPYQGVNALDSLGVTYQNCTINYEGIYVGYIDSIWVNGAQATVIWSISDSISTNTYTTTYDLTQGNGMYYLQISIYCPVKSTSDFFTITQSVYLQNGQVYTAETHEDRIWDFLLFPNPFNDFITLKTNGEELIYCLYSLDGELILKDKVDCQEQIINFKDISPGIYIFKIETKDFFSTRKIIKH